MRKKTETRKLSRERNKGMLMGAVRAEIAAPVGVSWDELGTVLRALRSMGHRCMNDAAFADELARRDGGKVAPQTVAYRVASESAKEWVEWARKHKDADVQRRAVEPSSHVVLGWASKAHDNVQRWHADEKARRPSRLPTMKSGAPIYVTRQAWDIEELDGDVVLSMSLVAGRSGGRRTVKLVSFHGANWSILRGIAKGEIESGALQIVYDERARRKDGKRGKWIVLLPYKMARPEVKTGGGALIVHRGQRNFVYMLPSTGTAGAKPIAGTNISEQKRRHEAVLKEIKRGSNPAELGSGAKGRGRKRRFAAFDTRRAKLDEVLKTLCRQVAAQVVKQARATGCTCIVIENYGGIEPSDDRVMRRFLPRFPLHLLKLSIARACEKSGLGLDECEASYLSARCPQCKEVDTGAHNHTTGDFHCRNCGLSRAADYVAAFNMLTLVFPDEDTAVHAAFRNANELRKRLMARKEQPEAAE